MFWSGGRAKECVAHSWQSGKRNVFRDAEAWFFEYHVEDLPAVEFLMLSVYSLEECSRLYWDLNY